MNAQTEASDDHLTEEVIDIMRDAIHKHGGNEIFFVASRTASEELLDGVEVLCLGNAHAVTALLDRPQPGQVVIHNHPSGNLLPSDPDISLASHFGNNDVGFYIVNNSVTGLCPVVRARKQQKRVDIGSDLVEEALGSGGQLSQIFKGYEPRQQQIEMANLVAESFNKDKIALIEAGTGTGKSLAYLIPAALWAKANNAKVLVATHTINLQEQLSSKDVPLLRKLKGMDVEAAVLKGRGNYLCLRKLNDMRSTPALIPDEEEVALGDVASWAQRTEEGTWSDMSMRLPDGLWQKMAADADDCNRVKCPVYDDCFYYKARRAAASAQLLIVNHHLLLADLFLRADMGDYKRSVILPATKRVILDEAHHLEDVATSFGSGQISSKGLVRILGRLYRMSRRRKEIGSLVALVYSLQKQGGEDAKDIINLLQDKLIKEVDDLRELVRQHLLNIALSVQAFASTTKKDRLVRVTKAVETTPFWTEEIQPLVQDLCKATAAVVRQLGKLMTRLEDKGLEDDRDFQGLMLDINAVRNKLTARVRNLSDFLEGDANTVRWLQLEGRSDKKIGVRICLSPIDVSGLLHDRVFKPMETVVLTSATLCTNQRFDYQKDRIGLAPEPPPLAKPDPAGMPVSDRVQTLRIQSPFDLPNQVYVGVPRDVGVPGAPAANDALVELVEKTVNITDGSAFVLFTSYNSLDAIFNGVSRRKNVPFRLLKQGVGSRTHLLDQFRRHTRSVLFGADSFWEGVDVQGEALRLVILTKLPFRVPSEPVYEARAEAVTAAGGDAFMELALPQAILRFKQGFGRLIRHRKDWGAVVITDPRLFTKRYGRQFLKAIAPVPVRYASSEDVLGELQDFFDSRKA